ncbi:MAG: hypothetical protein M3303_02895 [Gemmatimonadota bacterium]|nr:hypothetical protein [Gemmatimonadota bacterium]
MMIRIYGLGVRSRPAAIALAAAAVAVGAVFLAFGIVLLLGLAAVGTVLGAGVLVFRTLTGRGADRLHPRREVDLDPTLEVFPTDVAAPAPKLRASSADELE